MTEKYYKENAVIEAVASRISEWFDVSNTASYALIETALDDVTPENIIFYGFDKDLSTLVEQYGYDGVTEVLRKMIESEKE